MRGQAFIVFEDIDSAKKAVASMQGFPFHDKKMRIAFAKVRHIILVKIQQKNPTYNQPDYL